MAEEHVHQVITIAHGEGADVQEVVTGSEKTDFEITEGTKKEEEGDEEKKLQCHSSNSDSDSKSDSKSDSNSKSDSKSDSNSKSDSDSKSGSDSGTTTLKEKKRTKKTKGKGLKEIIKKLSGRKSRGEDKKMNKMQEGVKAKKLSPSEKLQCHSSDSDSKSGSDSASKSGSDSGTKTLKDKRSNKSLKEKLNKKKEAKEKKKVLLVEEVAGEDEVRENKKMDEGEEDKTSLLNKLHCDSSNSGSDSGSSSKNDESKGQGKKVEQQMDIKEKLKEKLSIQNTDEDKKTHIAHEIEKESGVIGENTTIIAEKPEETIKAEESPQEEKKAFLDKVKDKMLGNNKKPTGEGVVTESTELKGDMQGSKEKKGILEKIMEKLPSYRKNNEDEGEKDVATN